MYDVWAKYALKTNKRLKFEDFDEMMKVNRIPRRTAFSGAYWFEGMFDSWLAQDKKLGYREACHDGDDQYYFSQDEFATNCPAC